MRLSVHKVNQVIWFKTGLPCQSLHSSQDWVNQVTFPTDSPTSGSVSVTKSDPISAVKQRCIKAQELVHNMNSENISSFRNALHLTDTSRVTEPMKNRKLQFVWTKIEWWVLELQSLIYCNNQFFQFKSRKKKDY